ncbi:uncharacterized protein LOC142231976 [Haematobia irritans]|uniref:uncharacterized protein LOC142231976 n=1 Tax=Haematobia irritans TaxID=7368 RepID=UPI003F505B2A
MSVLVTTILAALAILAIQSEAQNFCLPQPYSYRHFVFGQEERNATVTKVFSYGTNIPPIQTEYTLNYNYEDDQNLRISHIILYVGTDNIGTANAFISSGGIGQSQVTVSMVASNSRYIRYMIVIFTSGTPSV